MSCAGTDATYHAVNFQRWPSAENSLGGGRGEHQKPLWGCGGGSVGHRPAAAGKRWPQPERGVWLRRLGPWRIGQSSWKDGSFVTLLFPSVMAANGGNSVTPA